MAESPSASKNVRTMGNHARDHEGEPEGLAEKVDRDPREVEHTSATY